MWAVVRFLRASWLFTRIFASYLLQLGLGRVFGRERMSARWEGVHRNNARRMYRGFVKLRGVYIKLGQILSIMGTFLPRSYSEELEGLQDEVPPRPYGTMARSFKRAFGVEPTEAFASFAREPIAAASLGQVHEARSKDGERLAVKLLYPRVATIIKIDMRVLSWVLRVYSLFVPVKQLDRVHQQLQDMLDRETDLENEARCLERMAENFRDDDDVIFPSVRHDLTCRSVLTMTFMDGVKISRVDALAELELDPSEVATKLVQSFYKQVFIDRFFHADPHPGNFFVQRGAEGQPRIVMLDLGSASVVQDNLADGMLDVLSGLMTRDDTALLRGIETMGFVAEDGDRELLERTVRRYFEKLLNLNFSDMSKVSKQVGQFGADVAGKLAVAEARRAELRELMRSVQYPVGWFYVERAVILMFGLSMKLAPTLDTLTVGFPYVMKFLAEQQVARATAQPQPVAAAPVVAQAAPVPQA
ncbi:ABC-1 domain protein [Haliangium ochraceum DSM 14365]|uniref:ABC-1 domain protein n=2 Tax=Haliangium ochraceum TaxID=80816 RepID=D0LQ95_HALO1|nr:ABC-1 domain protein [Haliangium ochraceum DSM 14365]